MNPIRHYLIDAADRATAGQVPLRPLSAARALLLRAEGWLREHEDYVVAAIGGAGLIGIALAGWLA